MYMLCKKSEVFAKAGAVLFPDPSSRKGLVNKSPLAWIKKLECAYHCLSLYRIVFTLVKHSIYHSIIPRVSPRANKQLDVMKAGWGRGRRLPSKA